MNNFKVEQLRIIMQLQRNQQQQERVPILHQQQLKIQAEWTKRGSFFYTAIPVCRISSQRGEGWFSSINTGSIRVFTSIVIRHRCAAVEQQSPLMLRTTTAISMSLSGRAHPLLYDPNRYTFAGPIALTTARLYLLAMPTTVLLSMFAKIWCCQSVPGTSLQTTLPRLLACRKGILIRCLAALSR